MEQVCAIVSSQRFAVFKRPAKHCAHSLVGTLMIHLGILEHFCAEYSVFEHTNWVSFLADEKNPGKQGFHEEIVFYFRNKLNSEVSALQAAGIISEPQFTIAQQKWKYSKPQTKSRVDAHLHTAQATKM